MTLYRTKDRLRWGSRAFHLKEGKKLNTKTNKITVVLGPFKRLANLIKVPHMPIKFIYTEILGI